ncbi:hypothetical protein D0962_30105 [Leptolyngbyaceae cyanobacterium CCMR0082]|uniref:Cytochrome oxidase subunit III n=1 Tax=Adonisia turfae CCMR0082 TaxID=2304604 RepID=A0A6M0SEL7_9CYAN|nr:hypothetical protein [Adonisia turfae CCMR0082]
MSQHNNRVQKIELKFQLWGWALFILSASFFMAASIRVGDVLSLLGSLFFLFACILFLIPLVIMRKS